MADSQRQLTTDDIVEYVGETYAGRGQNYFYDDRIVAPKVRGNSIAAECLGSQPEPYEVEVGVRDGEIQWSTCSCPVREPCKHVAALLYTYVEEPESFQHPERLRRRLGRMAKDDLVELVMQIAERDADIERYLERHVLSTESEGEEIGYEEVRNLAERAFSAGFDHAGGTGLSGAVPGIVEELERLRELGDERARDGDAEGALAVWTPVAEVVLEHGDLKGAGTHRLHELLVDLEDGIARHVTEVHAGDIRESALEALWRLYLADLARGGGDLGRQFRDVLAGSASDDERRRFADRARRRLERIADSDGAPAPESVVELVDFLDAFVDGPPEDRILEVLDELEAGPEIVEALLAIDEVDEAAARAENIDVSWEFGEALDAFVDAGHPDLAEKLARARLGESAAPGVQEWLVSFFDGRGRPEAALDIMCRMFEQHPTRERFRHIERLARQIGEGASYVATARAILREEAPREFLRLALDEGAVDAAVERWREIAGEWTPRAWQSSDLELELAEAVESSHPEVAAGIYVAEAGMLAESGGRESFRRAVELLERSQRILEAADRGERWRQLRDEFVGEHGTNETLVEMMESAGIG